MTTTTMILSIVLCVLVYLSVKNSVLVQGLTCGPISRCFQEVPYADRNPLYKYTCHCDKECSAYDDCCIDSLYRGQLEKRNEELCVSLYMGRYSPRLNIYVKVKCPESWDKHDSIKSGCEWNYIDLQDPYTRLPVTNPRTRVTYKNYYCAICHNDGVHSVPWEIDFTNSGLEKYNRTHSNVTKKFAMEHLTYNKDTGDWGVWLYDEGEKRFVPSYIFFKAGYLRRKTRWCIPNVVSDCGPAWLLEEVREKCLSYMDVIKVAGVQYRNVHCAMCNYQNTNEVVYERRWCVAPTGRPVSFSALFQGAYDEEPKEDPCDSGQLFDVFTKECRGVTCLPGETLTNGECTRETWGK